MMILVALATSISYGSRDGLDLEASFRNPPDDTRPGCYWYWINDNVSREGLTRDLEAMARVGIGRAYIGHIHRQRDPEKDTPVGPVKFGSEAWWETVRWAVKEADRCGVEIGFFNGPGWSQSGGPWLKPEQSMRFKAHTETRISGGKRIEIVLPTPKITTFPVTGGSKPQRLGPIFPEEHFQDTCVVAFKLPETEVHDAVMKGASISGIRDADNLLDGSHETFANFRKGKTEFTLTLASDELAIQSLRIVPLDSKISLGCTIEASTDGKQFKEIGRHSEERGHQGSGSTDPILIAFSGICGG